MKNIQIYEWFYVLRYRSDLNNLNIKIFIGQIRKQNNNKLIMPLYNYKHMTYDK